MNTTLNNYTIEDFVRFKKPIYNHCVRLTRKKEDDYFHRDVSDAEDLFQESYLYVYNQYFNTPKKPLTDRHFINTMKKCVEYAYHRRITTKNNKVYFKADHYQDTEKSEYLFMAQLVEQPKIFEDIRDNPDYNTYMKGLKFSERLVVDYILKGYNKSEIGKIFNKQANFVDRTITKIKNNVFKEGFYKSPVIHKVLKVKKEGIVDDLAFVKSKVKNFEIIFKTNKLVKLYSLYLQGFDHKIIAKDLNKSVSQVNVEIYRINQKIKKYAI